ncbi:MAG: oligosaccharide flippase family protein [Candidatus Limnocylindrales bacterium]|jgi:O-antigen/teichoic acid export membrane protein
MPAPELLRRVLPRGEFSRNVLTLVAGTGIAQVIVVVSSPIVTRLYTPADYGLYSVATSIMTILIAVTCLRYEFAVLLPATDETAANVVALALLVNLGMSMASFVFLGLAGASILTLLSAAAVGPYVLLVTLGQLGGGAAGTLVNWAVRTKTFSEIAAFRLIQAVALVTVQVGLGVVGLGSAGLMLGDVTGRISGSSRLARSAWRTNAAAFRRVSRAGIAAAARRYRWFPTFSSPSALMNALGLEVPLLSVVAFYGAANGGRYALADRACAIPLTLVAAAVGQVYLAEVARNARDQPAAVRGLFLRTTRSLARMAIGPAILLAALGPLLAGPVFGPNWSETGLFVAILAPMYFVAFVTAATGDTLYVVERLDLQLVREVVRLVLLGGAVPLAAASGLSATGAIVLLSAAGCLNYSLYGLISWYAIVAAPRRSRPTGEAPAAADPVATHADGDDAAGIP